MSKVVFTVRVKKNGVLANADSTPLLSSRDGTFGMRRVDTGEVIYANDTPMQADGVGLYSFTHGSAIAGVTYQAFAEVVVNGQPIWVERNRTASDPTARTYLTVEQAEAIASLLPSLAAWEAAAPDAKVRALEGASADVDAAGPWQGRRYEPTQPREFPRVAYESRLPAQYPLAGQSGVADTIWDWDETAKAAVVPVHVERAVLYQADAILSGEQSRVQAAAHAGLASQSTGGLSESYRPGAGAVDGLAVLCLPAARAMARYRLRTGRLL